MNSSGERLKSTALSESSSRRVPGLALGCVMVRCRVRGRANARARARARARYSSPWGAWHTRCGRRRGRSRGLGSRPRAASPACRGTYLVRVRVRVRARVRLRLRLRLRRRRRLRHRRRRRRRAYRWPPPRWAATCRCCPRPIDSAPCSRP